MQINDRLLFEVVLAKLIEQLIASVLEPKAASSVSEQLCQTADHQTPMPRSPQIELLESAAEDVAHSVRLLLTRMYFSMSSRL